MKKTGKINYIEMPSRDLEATKAFFTSTFGWSFVDYGTEYVAIENAGLDGGKIVKDTFDFPGGRRFHFTDPSGNEFAVWSEPVG